MKTVFRCVSIFAVCLVLASPSLYAQDVFINELMASNNGSVLTADGEDPDWIEIYNASDQPVSLAGMYLSDRFNNLTKWQFPVDRPELTTVPPIGYTVVWMSGRTSTATELHADFSLDADGEAVVLTSADGQRIVDFIEFGLQSPDISFGRALDEESQWQYLYLPTPGSGNVIGYGGLVQPVEFSVERGFYDESFLLTLTCETENVSIWYTLDGSVPNSEYADLINPLPPNGQPYSEPIEINRTTCIRAAAFKPDWKGSPVATQTYIFLDDVIRQPQNPAGFPTSWGGRRVDYAMDQRVVNDPQYSDEIKDDLKSTPIVCIALSNEDLFGSQGIYSHPTQKGNEWERAASMEWIDPNTGDHFGVDAGLRILGGAYNRSRASNPKSGLQFFFRGEYGLSKLNYPLFPDTDVQEFDRIGLRNIWNYSWIGDSGGYGADYLRDCFARDTIRDMGRLTPYGRPVQVFINGLYWGLYIMTERIDNVFAADHLGGNPEDYDVLEAPSNQGGGTLMTVNTGDKMTIPPEWDILYDMAENSNLSTPEAYEAIQAYVDIPAMIDYMLMIYYTGSRDAPVFLGDQRTPRNFYALRTHEPAGPFLFIPWDVEWCLESPFEDRTGIVGVYQPHVLMDALSVNPEFRHLLEDRISQAFFNDGPLTREKVTQRYMARANEIYGAIVGESARWGDVLSFQPRTREDWLDEVNRLVDDYFAIRTEVVLDQLRNRGWYPRVNAPEFLINGQPNNGGVVSAGDTLTLAATEGAIYYTLDGADPRLAEEPGENESFVLIPEQADKRIQVPTQDIGTDWRGANEPYDDSDWNHGNVISEVLTGGVGYERSGTYDSFITYDVENEMFGENGSCYIRIPFTVPPADLERVADLTLRVRCDDGFVAYLNGTEVASINKPQNLAWNSTCANRPDSTAFVTIALDDVTDSLRAGTNILAVQAINQSPTSSDFLFSVELIGSEEIQAPISPSALLYTDPITLDQPLHIQARAFNNGEWSALSEAVFTLE